LQLSPPLTSPLLPDHPLSRPAKATISLGRQVQPSQFGDLPRFLLLRNNNNKPVLGTRKKPHWHPRRDCSLPLRPSSLPHATCARLLRPLAIGHRGGNDLSSCSAIELYHRPPASTVIRICGRGTKPPIPLIVTSFGFTGGGFSFSSTLLSTARLGPKTQVPIVKGD
jgi:hypothetical protein